MILPRSPVPDAVVEGRRVSEHFRELVRASCERGSDEAQGRYYAARTALLRAGMNAAPYLLRQATRSDREGPLISLLRDLLDQLGRHRGEQRFPPPSHARREARTMLESIRPPAAWVAGQLAKDLAGRSEDFWRAYHVVTEARDPNPTAYRLITNRMAFGDGPEWIQRYRVALEEPLSQMPPPVEEPEPNDPGTFSRALLLGQYGPASRAAVPWMAARMQAAGPSRPATFALALALLEIQPDHPLAAEWVGTVAREAAFSPHNQLSGSPASTLLSVANGPRTRVTSPVSLAAIESLARREIEGWEPRGLAHEALPVLERVAPDRAGRLYLAEVTSDHRPNIRIVAAGGLLRVEGTNEVAIRFLAGQLTTGSHLAWMAAEQLGEASPVADVALLALQSAAAAAPDYIARKAALSLQRIEMRRWENRSR